VPLAAGAPGCSAPREHRAAFRIGQQVVVVGDGLRHPFEFRQLDGSAQGLARRQHIHAQSRDARQFDGGRRCSRRQTGHSHKGQAGVLHRGEKRPRHGQFQRL